MENLTTYSRMMTKMERATEWILENRRSSQKIKIMVLRYLTIHYLERALVLTPQIKTMEKSSRAKKKKFQARRGFREKKNGFLTL